MSSRVGKQVRVVKGEDGKAKLVRKKTYVSKNQHLKAARLEKAWKGKSRT
jgi:hypothetical protein